MTQNTNQIGASQTRPALSNGSGAIRQSPLEKKGKKNTGQKIVGAGPEAQTGRSECVVLDQLHARHIPLRLPGLLLCLLCSHGLPPLLPFQRCTPRARPRSIRASTRASSSSNSSSCSCACALLFPGGQGHSEWRRGSQQRHKGPNHPLPLHGRHWHSQGTRARCLAHCAARAPRDGSAGGLCSGSGVEKGVGNEAQEEG